MDNLAKNSVFDKVENYLNQPVNFGVDNDQMRMAEHDAFMAGWDSVLELIVNELPADEVPELVKKLHADVLDRNQ